MVETKGGATKPRPEIDNRFNRAKPVTYDEAFAYNPEKIPSY